MRCTSNAAVAESTWRKGGRPKTGKSHPSHAQQASQAVRSNNTRKFKRTEPWRGIEGHRGQQSNAVLGTAQNFAGVVWSNAKEAHMRFAKETEIFLREVGRLCVKAQMGRGSSAVCVGDVGVCACIGAG